MCRFVYIYVHTYACTHVRQTLYLSPEEPVLVKTSHSYLHTCEHHATHMNVSACDTYVNTYVCTHVWQTLYLSPEEPVRMSKLLNALVQDVGRGALLPLQRPRTVATKQKIDRKKNDLRCLMNDFVCTHIWFIQNLQGYPANKILHFRK